MVQRLFPKEPASGPRIRELEGSIEQLRMKATFSADQSERGSAISRLADIDSFSIIIETSPFEDARALAREGLRRRLSTFSKPLIDFLAGASSSPSIREAASEFKRQE